MAIDVDVWSPFRGVTVAIVLELSMSASRAQEVHEAATPPQSSRWIVTLGGFGDLKPKFEGARHHAIWCHPIIDYGAEGSREWLSLPFDGFDFPLIETQNFRAAR